MMDRMMDRIERAVDWYFDHPITVLSVLGGVLVLIFLHLFVF